MTRTQNSTTGKPTSLVPDPTVIFEKILAKNVALWFDIFQRFGYFAARGDLATAMKR